jgi:regulator of nonsense transcripts 3
VKTTPLLEALIAEKSALKDKEAILRNHAHYRDGAKRDKGKGPIIVASGSSRGGRGATAASAAAGAGDSHGHSGKRARRGKNKDDTKETGDGGATPKGPVHIQSKSGAPSGPAPAAGGSRRRERNREAQKAAAASGEPQSSTETQTTSAPTTIALITDDLPDEGPPTPIPASATQRRRPAIALGLQSRHFEAALSGVVPGGPRAPRRERKEKEKEGAEGAAGSGTTEFESTSSAAAAGGGERKVSDGSRSRKRAERSEKGANKGMHFFESTLNESTTKFLSKHATTQIHPPPRRRKPHQRSSAENPFPRPIRPQLRRRGSYR